MGKPVVPPRRIISNSFSPSEVELLSVIFENVHGETASHSKKLFQVATHAEFSKLARKILNMALKVRENKQRQKKDRE